MITLSDVKEVQPKWFSPENKRFFGDVSYEVLQGKTTKKNYLVRSTNAWTDMFDRKNKTLHYRVNSIGEDLKIGKLIETVFKTRDEVKEWLKEN
jgi:hypothetical protein